MRALFNGELQSVLDDKLLLCPFPSMQNRRYQLSAAPPGHTMSLQLDLPLLYKLQEK